MLSNLKIKNKPVLLNVILVATLALLISGCPKKKNSDWIYEEIIHQINELRQDIKHLREEVSALDKKVSSMPSADNRSSIAEAALKEVKLDKKFALGDSSAGIAIIEFTDYQCPFCAKHARETLPKIRKNLVDSGKVMYVMKDYPLSFHKEAEGAAIATHCAGAQGQFWAMHDAIFANTKQLSADFYKKTAADLKLNTTKFADCLSAPEHAKHIEESVKYGESIGVSGTPKFFIGKVKGDVITDVVVVGGAQPYEKFERTVNELLNKK